MRRRIRSSACGLAEVEFATVLPLLLLLALGVVDLGRGLIAYVELEQAAQEGAIYGSFAPSDPALIETRVRSSSVGAGPIADPAVVDVVVECPDGNRKILVRVSHDLAIITPIVGQMFGGAFALETTSVGWNFTDLPCTETP